MRYFLSSYGIRIIVRSLVYIIYVHAKNPWPGKHTSIEHGIPVANNDPWVVVVSFRNPGSLLRFFSVRDAAVSK